MPYEPARARIHHERSEFQRDNRRPWSIPRDARLDNPGMQRLLKICLGAENNGHAIRASKKTSGGADKEQGKAGFSRTAQTSMGMCAFFSPDMFGQSRHLLAIRRGRRSAIEQR